MHYLTENEQLSSRRPPKKILKLRDSRDNSRSPEDERRNNSGERRRNLQDKRRSSGDRRRNSGDRRHGDYTPEVGRSRDYDRRSKEIRRSYSRKSSKEGRKFRDDHKDRIGYYSDDSRYSTYNSTGDGRDDRGGK